MKSTHPSFPEFRRALVAAAVVLATGTAVSFAQSTSGSSQTGSDYNSSTSSTSGSMGSSMNSSEGSGMSSSDQSGSSMNTSESKSSSSEKLSWGDRRFVTHAADDGQAEVQIAQLAAQKASNPQVRDFAQQMVQQHEQVNSQLMSLAQEKNVKIDQDNSKDRAYKRLSKAEGSDFDREFVDHMVDEHEKDIKMYEKAADKAKDPQVKQFASNTLDHLRQHLQEAQQLQQQLVPTGGEQSSYRSSGTTSSGSMSTGMSSSASTSTGFGSASSTPSSSWPSSTSSTASTETTSTTSTGGGVR